ncbi:unnamed protein product, partial [Ceratitis capitata]
VITYLLYVYTVELLNGIKKRLQCSCIGSLFRYVIFLCQVPALAATDVSAGMLQQKRNMWHAFTCIPIAATHCSL